MVEESEASRLRIGELAELTDKTVRALHLYEEKGLIEPVERSPGGFRLYDRANVARIHYIDRLQKLGLSLTAIGPSASFDVRPDGPPAQALKACAAELSRQLGARSAVTRID